MIQIIGINHKSAPIPVREQFCLSSTQQDWLLTELKHHPLIYESFVISTCNRTEIYLHVCETGFSIKDVFSIIMAIKKPTLLDPIESFFYVFSGQQALQHLFEVVCGLDSLVIGEKQILGQFKNAIEKARRRQTLHRNFNILSNLAIRAGKKSQSETQIGYGGSSISWAALALAEKILGTLEGRSILIIGAGKMSSLTLDQLRQRKVCELHIMNRSQDKAMELARKFKAKAWGFCDVKEILAQVDLCLCASGAPHYVIENDVVERVMAQRPRRPLICVDISMPRNIDPRVAQHDSVQVYSIDDLNDVVKNNLNRRLAAAEDVHKIITDKLQAYQHKMIRNDETFKPEYLDVKGSDPLDRVEVSFKEEEVTL